MHPRHTTPSIRLINRRKEEKEIKWKSHRISARKKNKAKRRQRKTTFEPAAPVGGTSSRWKFYFLVGLVLCYPVCHLLPTFVYCSFPSTPPVPPPLRVPLVGFYATLPVAPPLPIPLDTTHGGCAALSTQLSLILVPPHHEPFGCFEDPPVSTSRLFGCSGPQRGLNSKHQGGKFR